MFWKSFADCLTGIYVAGVHALAFMGGITIYYYYYEPAELCRRVIQHLFLPFGWK